MSLKDLLSRNLSEINSELLVEFALKLWYSDYLPDLTDLTEQELRKLG